MAYQAFRTNGGPTYYPANPTAWQADVLESGLIYAFVILAFSFYVILPGIRGKEKLFTFIRVTLSLYIGAVIILTNWSYSWESAEIHTRTKYKAGTGQEISADIGVHIGLRGINITLKGTPEKQLNETINYNEHFSWEWEQGRFGFGPYAGKFNQEYRAAQFRGLPLPILWIAEYFTFDGEGIRWGRHYRQAGWYSHIMLWLCFPLWLLTNILFFMLLRNGAYMLMFTGACMLTANIIWASIRNFNDLKIPWEGGVMEFSFGASFWICLITGILCVVLGLLIRILDLRFPTQLTSFFGVDVLQDTNEIAPAEEIDNVETRKDYKAGADNGMMMGDIDGEPNGDGPKPGQPMKPPGDKRGGSGGGIQTIAEEEDDEELYMPPPPVEQAPSNRFEKRKSRALTLKFQKSRRRRPPPPPPAPTDEPDEMYVNTPFNASTSDVRINMT